MTVESSSNVWKRSFPARACAFLGLLAAAFAVGCGGVPKTYYYTLQVPAAPRPLIPGRTMFWEWNTSARRKSCGTIASSIMFLRPR